MKACLICRVAVGLSVRWLLKEWLASLDKDPTELLANLHAQSGVRRLGGWVGIQHVSATFLTCEHEHCDFMLLVALCWSNFGVLWTFRRFSHITCYYFMWCILMHLDISWYILMLWHRGQASMQRHWLSSGSNMAPCGTRSAPSALFNLVQEGDPGRISPALASTG